MLTYHFQFCTCLPLTPTQGIPFENKQQESTTEYKLRIRPLNPSFHQNRSRQVSSRRRNQLQHLSRQIHSGHKHESQNGRLPHFIHTFHHSPPFLPTSSHPLPPKSDWAASQWALASASARPPCFAPPERSTRSGVHPRPHFIGLLHLALVREGHDGQLVHGPR